MRQQAAADYDYMYLPAVHTSQILVILRKILKGIFVILLILNNVPYNHNRSSQ